MKKRRRDASCGALLFALFAFGCGTEPTTERKTVAFRLSKSGIHSIWKDNVNLTKGTAGYYVIGSCDPIDNPDTNVTSVGSDGHTLTSPSGLCPGAPFSIRLLQLTDNVILAAVKVGPIPVDYASLSVPLDFPDSVITEFQAQTDSMFLGGCGDFTQLAQAPVPELSFLISWGNASGFLGRFDEIPTPCTDLFGGSVGLAETKAPVVWGKVHGPFGTITRTIVAGSYESLQFFRNTKLRVHNIELSFGAVPKDEVVRIAEKIRID